jgi:hypothetical protein
MPRDLPMTSVEAGAASAQAGPQVLRIEARRLLDVASQTADQTHRRAILRSAYSLVQSVVQLEATSPAPECTHPISEGGEALKELRSGPPAEKSTLRTQEPRDASRTLARAKPVSLHDLAHRGRTHPPSGGPNLPEPPPVLKHSACTARRMRT